MAKPSLVISDTPSFSDVDVPLPEDYIDLNPDPVPVPTKVVHTDQATDDAYYIDIEDVATGMRTRLDGMFESPKTEFSPDETLLLITTRVGQSDVPVKLYDLKTGKLSTISTFPDGSPARGYDARFANDGQSVLFSSFDGLVANDTNNLSDVYLGNLATGAIKRLTETSNGGQMNADARDIALDLRPNFPPVFERVLGFQSGLMRPVFP